MREAEIDARPSSRPSNKELAASRPNPPGEWGLLYSLQALAGLTNKMLRPISLSGVVAATRKTRSQLSCYFGICALAIFLGKQLEESVDFRQFFLSPGTPPPGGSRGP